MRDRDDMREIASRLDCHGDWAQLLACTMREVAEMLNHQRPADQSHALAAPSDASWPSLVSSAIAQCHLCNVAETPGSAQQLLDAAGGSAFSAEGGSLSMDVEQTLFESFIDDDYEGRLHLTTLRQNDKGGQVVGIAFWREVPDTEMREWINFDALSASISDLRGLVIDEDDHDDEHTEGKSGANSNSRHRRSLVPVREESLHWLYQATSSRHLQRAGRSRATTTSTAALSREELIDGLTHRWIKIELLAVQKSFWGHRYGSLLLATALQEAYQQKSNRAILHVAGGYSNVPAVKLYQRFGFVGVPAGDGGIFNKPDRDLFVLGNIGAALQSLHWNECLPLPAPNNGNPLIEDGDVDAGGDISA